MLPRILEPEVMDAPEEAADYDAMDHAGVNRLFVDDFLAAVQAAGVTAESATADDGLQILDAGTGTAQIPIELASRFRERGDGAQLRITAADLAREMLKVAERNVAAASLADCIRLDCVDCKSLPYGNGEFDAVTSNSIVHHIPEPRAVFAEMWRVLRRGGLLFVRDLLRPPDAATLNLLVETYAGEENPHQQQMFRDSLHAALTLDELRTLLAEFHIPPSAARQTSDRHWTLSTVR